MYIKDKVKAGLLYLFGFIAVGAAVALIVCFVSILHLRTEYRAFCLEVNDAILATSAEERFIGRGEEKLPLDTETLDYYDMLLLADGAQVISRDAAEPNGRSIVIFLGEDRLTLTSVEQDGSLINLRWETAEGVRSYNVRSTQVSFMSLAAYYTNYARRAENGAR